jgi:C4-dicarboxylate-specific signal transduction histidine kinase
LKEKKQDESNPPSHKRSLNDPKEATLSNEEIAIAKHSKLSAMGQMASSIAHEINNPLSVIRMNAEILLEYCQDAEQSEKILEKCRKIISTTDRISGIIRALKSISASSTKPNFQWTKLSTVIDDVAELCANRFKMASVPLEMDIGKIRDMNFYIDAAQISQAVINLLNNSFDAIQTLPERWVRLHGHIDNNNLSLMVTDSGNGIPDDILKDVLNPFFSTKANHQGLGIGLNLVQSYAAFHEGSLSYALVDGHTTFVLEFPLRKIQPSN